MDIWKRNLVLTTVGIILVSLSVLACKSQAPSSHRVTAPVVAVPVAKTQPAATPEPPLPEVFQSPSIEITSKMPRFMVEGRAEVAEALSLDQISVFDEWWTDEYFYDLEWRKQDAIAYVKGRDLSFYAIGWKHDPGRKGVRKKVYDQIIANVDKDTLFVYEENCDDERVDWNVFLRTASEKDKIRLGRARAPEQLAKDLANLDTPQTRIVREHPEIQSICGEEWPFYFDEHMDKLHRSLHPGRHKRSKYCQDFDSVKSVLVVLRSEITVIRTIEAMRRTGKSKAVILQGTKHLLDFEDFFIPQYGLNMELWFEREYDKTHLRHTWRGASKN